MNWWFVKKFPTIKKQKIHKKHRELLADHQPTSALNSVSSFIGAAVKNWWRCIGGYSLTYVKPHLVLTAEKKKNVFVLFSCFIVSVVEDRAPDPQCAKDKFHSTGVNFCKHSKVWNELLAVWLRLPCYCY